MGWRGRRNTAVGDQYKEPLRAIQLAAGASSASAAITEYGWVGLSIRATGANVRYNFNAPANATTSHYIGQNERIFITTPYGAGDTTINAIRDASTDGALEITVVREFS